MVAQYQRAKLMAAQNPEQALKEFRAMQQRWPQGSLHQEADLQIVSLLSRLGREGESKQRANVFLKQHPESPHAGELQQLLKE
jgi:outer membrane protein assembly factor BamD (BamD/ComL family)